MLWCPWRKEVPVWAFFLAVRERSQCETGFYIAPASDPLGSDRGPEKPFLNDYLGILHPAWDVSLNPAVLGFPPGESFACPCFPRRLFAVQPMHGRLAQ